jgi:hypothetical protein
MVGDHEVGLIEMIARVLVFAAYVNVFVAVRLVLYVARISFPPVKP